MSTQIDLFGWDVPPPAAPILKKHDHPVRMQDKLAIARAQGKRLIRLDARPWDTTWIIKTILDTGGGGWATLHKFATAHEAIAKYTELLNSNLYAEG